MFLVWYQRDGCSLIPPLLSGFCSDNHLSQAMLLWQCFHIPHEIYYGNWFLLERERQRQRQGEREKTNILFFSQELVIFLPHSKFLDIFIIYKGIPFIFLFAYLATKKTKFLQNATSCSGTLETISFLAIFLCFCASSLRQSIDTEITTKIKVTFSVSWTWKLSITVFDSQVFPCF